MKILVLDEEFPYPLNTGKRIRSYHLLKGLAACHQVHYLAYGQQGSESATALEQTDIRTIPVPREVPPKSGMLFYLRLLVNLTSRWPYIVTSHYSQTMAELVSREIRNWRPDILLAEWTPYAAYFSDHPRITTVIAAHNVEAQIWQRYHQHEKSSLKKWYIGRQLLKIQRFEREVFCRADGVTAVSAGDAAQLTAVAPKTSVAVVDNGVDLAYFASTAEPGEREEHASKIVFCGSMDWRPNQDAVFYFVNEIFPLLRQQRPEVEAIFVGRNPPPPIIRLNDLPGITVTGTVDDVRPFLREAAVYVVPLRIGGGSRLKILEALAAKRAVVSTSVGAEGLKVMAGEHLLVADQPEDFAARVVSLLDDRELRRRLGRAGRHLVEKSYGWPTQAAKLEEFLVALQRRNN